MSRDIYIFYENTEGNTVDIEIDAPYYLFGGQHRSMRFWRNNTLKEIGIERLTMLGFTDPIYFSGWEEMDLLFKEIELFSKNFKKINYDPQPKAVFLAHLTYCGHLLISSTPEDCIPIMSIG